MRHIHSAASSGGRQGVLRDSRFDGKTVVVTGAASGIGRATASRIAREGGTVIAVDISAEKLQEFAAASPADSVVPVPGDVTKQEDIDKIVAAADGRIDGLANIAGVNDDFSPIHETSDQIWDRVIGINLTGVFRLTRAVVPSIPFPGNVFEEGSARLRPFQAAIPTGATAEQLATPITILLIDDGVNINGAVLPSDGGWSVQ